MTKSKTFVNPKPIYSVGGNLVTPANVEIKVDPEQSFSSVDPLPADPVLEDTVNVPEPPVIPVQPDSVVLPTDVPLTESTYREPSLSYTKVGIPVIFGGENAAIITKVWDNGLVNLIVFSSEHPVSDIKTKVPYGEGPNTWKEIN